VSPNPLSPAGSVALYEEDRDSQHHAHGQHDPDKGHVDRMLNCHGSEGTGRGVAFVRTPGRPYRVPPDLNRASGAARARRDRSSRRWRALPRSNCLPRARPQPSQMAYPGAGGSQSRQRQIVSTSASLACSVRRGAEKCADRRSVRALESSPVCSGASCCATADRRTEHAGRTTFLVLYVYAVWDSSSLPWTSGEAALPTASASAVRLIASSVRRRCGRMSMWCGSIRR